MRPDLPTGTVTFLFTDVEGSTRLLQSLGADAYADALAEHRRLIREACAPQGGVEVDTQGDAMFFAFPTAGGALSAARELTDALSHGHTRVRVGVYTGTPLLTEEGYVGEDIHRAARIAAAGHGGQVLVAESTASLVDADLKGLGTHRFKDLTTPERVFQLGDDDFPPLRSLYRSSLPVPANPLIGRKKELVDVVRLLTRDDARLVTITGAGGVGKTRFAVAAALEVSQVLPDGAWFVPLAPLREADLVLPTVADTLGADGDLVRHIGDDECVLLLDNVEHVIDAAPGLAALVDACPRLRVLVTSREPLRVAAEREYPLSPLPESPAVELFRQRASAVAPELEIDYTVAAAICDRLDRLPLAVELAAARARALTPVQILERLGSRLDLLKGGRDADPRQRTLRATIEWSYDLLEADEQGVFERLSVFAEGFTLEAAEDVADADLDAMQSLVEKSLLRFSNGRYSMLETIREYAAERLDPGAADAVARRHRAYFVALAEASAADLHTAKETVTSAALALDFANIRAAVAHALAAHEPDDAGRILGAAYPYLVSYAFAEARAWADSALALRSLLSPDGLAELLVGAGEIARFSGDLDRAIELKDELVALDASPRRPNWLAATFADLAEIALERGEYARAREYADRSDAAGGGARAALVYTELSLRVGDLSAAEASGLTALEEIDEGAFNYGAVLESLGEVARRSGDDAVARERFVAALRAFARLRDAGGVADCLDGLGRIAVATGDFERAGHLIAAARRLRQDSGRVATRSDVPVPEIPGDVDGTELVTLDQAVGYALASID